MENEAIITIRTAVPEDAPHLLRIYEPYVTDTAITFEYDVPTLPEFRGRVEHTLLHYPYLVALKDGEIVGYAYASPFKERAAYDWSVETSIYVDMQYLHCGIGKKLYEALEEALFRMNIINVNACIASPVQVDRYLDDNSIRFHEHLGYRMVGTFHQCGYKFGTWYDMVWMEKMLSSHPDRVKPVILFPDLKM